MDNFKLSIQDQIRHMKTKGIKFNVTSESSARIFLSDNNYYFKIKAYAKNYVKDQNGQYVNLEFAYLKELSTIDMHLRRFIIRITLDIEHTLKTKLLRDCTNNHREDGYKIVRDFLCSHSDVRQRIESKKSKSYTSDLVEKFRNRYAIWNIVEILTFGDFVLLYKFYYSTYPSVHSYDDLLFAVKSIRNGAAHSNCIINTLRTPYSVAISPNYRLSTLCGYIHRIGASGLKTKLQNPVIHDFVAMLYLFHLTSFSSDLKRYAFEDLKFLLTDRIIRNKQYFTNNIHISTTYEFISKIVDFLSAESI